MVNEMASVTEKSNKFEEDHGLEYSSFSKMIVNSKILKKIRSYFVKTNTTEDNKKDPLIFNHHINVSPQETWTRDVVRMNIR